MNIKHTNLVNEKGSGTTVEGGSKKERKRLKKAKTEPGAKTRSEETQIKKITEFKSQGQKITEKEK